MLVKFVERHSDQQWGEYPYVEHLTRVAKIACGIKNTKKVHMLAMLHDVVEDTDTALDEIPFEVREDVAMLSRGVAGVGKTYREYVENIAVNGSEDAVIVKFADSVANYGLCVETGELERGERYKKNIELLYPKVFHVEVQWGLVDDLISTL